jgi:hypothetical protein
MRKKGQKPLACARGSELRLRIISTLPSRVREGAVLQRAFFRSVLLEIPPLIEYDGRDLPQRNRDLIARVAAFAGA